MKHIIPLVILLLLISGITQGDQASDYAGEKTFLAGAATSNVTPELGLPVIGGFRPFPATHVHDDLLARCIVLDDGGQRIAIVIIDILGIPREVTDLARQQIQQTTGIKPSHVLIAATHTHSAVTPRGPQTRCVANWAPKRKNLTPHVTSLGRAHEHPGATAPTAVHPLPIPDRGNRPQ